LASPARQVNQLRDRPPHRVISRLQRVSFWLGAAQTALALVTTLLIPALELKKK
jgi:hypothetical protein